MNNVRLLPQENMYPQGSSQDKILGVYVYAGIHHPADKNVVI